MPSSTSAVNIAVNFKPSRLETIAIVEEGLSQQDLDEAIGELERCEVRYIVFPLESQKLQWKKCVKTPLGEAGRIATTESDLKSSLTEVDQVGQTAQIQVDALMLQMLEILRLEGSIGPAFTKKVEAICEEVRVLVYSAMNDINFIAGEHDASFRGNRKFN